MKTTPCLDVTIRFVSPNHHGQRISHTTGDSRTRHLLLCNDGVTLSIKFVDKDGDTIREINYNFAQVLEYDCEGYVKVA